MRSRDERVRLEATKYYTARRMGWKETTAQQVTGADNGPVKFEDVTPAVDRIRSRISSIAASSLLGAKRIRTTPRASVKIQTNNHHAKAGVMASCMRSMPAPATNNTAFAGSQILVRRTAPGADIRSARRP
jgi:hypothetical protein